VVVPQIDVDELERVRVEGALLIDVREPDEYEEFRVPGATLIPLGDIPDRLAELPADRTFYVICRIGNRSSKATQFLIANGFDAVNVAGGSQEWAEAGKPIASGPEA
jgi:rhodanese-related sulfurtransferase